MGLWQVFAVGVFSFEEIGNGIEPESVHSHFAPVIDDAEHLFLYLRVTIVEIGLVMKETVPEILSGNRVPGPVGGLEILEDDAYVFILFGIVRPDIVVSFF